MFGLAGSAQGGSADGSGFYPLPRLLARGSGRRSAAFRVSPSLWNPTRKDDHMTREQKRQLRRGVLYIVFLTALGLLLIAGITA